ncbi:hypothetical protein SAMN05660662_0806 [Blastococcus aurantiacus]|uniref:Dolichyl-phosphate-mannose-protein mannosyltransferase n=1 Tax=Blastococcus aurantiacus TaxID=1550231 RepID=A0A1G7HSY8_9ACTN|nr:hypothetical protein [Blastococcus aurantiacus]SDF03552.1 hypothetical protein SAMN05660662_0806 [Blastococcus aurantiacus]
MTAPVADVTRARTAPAVARVLTAALLAAGALVVLARAAWYLVDRLDRPFPLTPYVFPQYWLDYGDGFVRRGLPGQLLRWVLGRPPDRGEAVLAATVLALAAVAGVLALAVALGRRAGSVSGGIAVAAAVVVSPLTLSLPVRDLGRPDSVGLAVLALLACLPWRRLPVPLAVGLVAALCGVATATQEFLLLVVAPVAVLALARCVPSRRARVLATGAALIPAAAVALLSAVRPARAAAVDRATAEAAAAGVPPPGALVPDHTSVLRLRYGFLDNLTAYYSLLDPLTVVATTLMWGGVAALTLGLVWQLMGGALRDRRFVAVLSSAVVVAGLLSCAGIDHRRWWALATMGGLAALVLLTPPSGAGAGQDRRRALLLLPAAALLVAAGWKMQLFPVFSLQV